MSYWESATDALAGAADSVFAKPGIYTAIGTVGTSGPSVSVACPMIYNEGEAPRSNGMGFTQDFIGADSIEIKIDVRASYLHAVNVIPRQGDTIVLNQNSAFANLPMLTFIVREIEYDGWARYRFRCHISNDLSQPVGH